MKKGVMWRARLLVAGLVVGVVALGATAPAGAGPTHAQEATLTSVNFMSTSVQELTRAEISATWTLPDNPATPAGMTLALPAELSGRTDSFSLFDSSGVAMGSCVVTETEIHCDFDSAYLTANPLNIGGTFKFWVQVMTDVDSSSRETYTIGGQTASITVIPRPTCETDCEFTGEDNRKNGAYQNVDDVILWTVVVGSDADGATAGAAMSVTDTPGPFQTLITSYSGNTYPRLMETSTLTVLNGKEKPSGFRAADPELLHGVRRHRVVDREGGLLLLGPVRDPGRWRGHGDAVHQQRHNHRWCGQRVGHGALGASGRLRNRQRRERRPG